MALDTLRDAAGAWSPAGTGLSLHMVGAPWPLSFGTGVTMFVALSGPGIWHAWGQESVDAARRRRERAEFRPARDDERA